MYLFFFRLALFTALIASPTLITAQSVGAVVPIDLVNSYVGGGGWSSQDIDGNYAIAGNIGDSRNLLNQDSLHSAGAAYIFERDPWGNWLQTQKLVAPTRYESGYFGTQVAIEGNYAYVTVQGDSVHPNSQLYGAVYVYERQTNGHWALFQKISPPYGPNRFGQHFALDGDQIWVTGWKWYSTGSWLTTYNYQRDSTGYWNYDTGVYSWGRNVAIHGNKVIMGDPEWDHDAGGAVVAEFSNDTWAIVDTLNHPQPDWIDLIGEHIDINDDFAVIGHPSEESDANGNNSLLKAGAAYIYKRDSAGKYNYIQKLVVPDRAGNRFFGHQVCLSGNLLYVGEYGYSNHWIQPGAEGRINVFQFDSLSNSFQRVDVITLPNAARWSRIGTLFSISDSVLLTKANGYTEVDANGQVRHREVAYVIGRHQQYSMARGNVFLDLNQDCQHDSNEPGIPNTMVSTDNGVATTISSSDGAFQITMPLGTQALSASPPHNVLTTAGCPSPSVTIDSLGTVVCCSEIPMRSSVGNQPWVNVATTSRRPCRRRPTTVNYCNLTATTMPNAIVTLKLPDGVIPVSSSMPYTLATNGDLVFNIGDLPAGGCGTIYVSDSLPCNTGWAGATLCATASIGPQQAYSPVGADWDGSYLQAEASCNMDSVIFSVQNSAVYPMTAPSTYYLFENQELVAIDSIQLQAVQSVRLKFPANGNTYRLEINQPDSCPWGAKAISFIEGCGTDSVGNSTQGQILLQSIQNELPWVATDCAPVLNSYDPNDKQVTPAGIGPNHKVAPGSRLAYRIRFQNTGTDTAFKVMVIDTLSPHLDVRTLQVGPSSHPHTLSIAGDSVLELRFLFHPIFLLDSATNEPASNGFLTYSIEPFDSVPVGTVVNNSAAIYFDFNSPVITNTSWVTLEDSVPVNLQAGPTISSELFGWQPLAICSNDSVLIGGSYRNTAGTYTDTLTAANGDDSLSTYQLSILPTQATTDTTNLCAGDSIFLAGAWRTSAGVFTDSLQAANGCDSLHQYVVLTHSYPISLDTLPVCGNDSVWLGSVWQKQPGQYMDTLSSQFGCDSAVLVTLIADNHVLELDTANICSTDSMWLGGAYRNQTGTYDDTLQTSLGCDSIVRTYLQVYPAYLLYDTIIHCGALPVMVHGSPRGTNNTNYVYYGTTAHGCDSIHYTYLHASLDPHTFSVTHICAGDSVWVAGAYRYAAGVYTDTFTNVVGCDSLHSTTVAIAGPQTTQRNLSICETDSIWIAGSWQNTSGLYTDSLQNQWGCDSIALTNLTVIPTLHYKSVLICNGTPVQVGPQSISTAGQFVVPLTNALGCDSTVVVTATVGTGYNHSVNKHICNGDSIWIAGDYRTAPGMFTEQLTSASGCDSIVATTLAVHPQLTSVLSTSICNGDSAQFGPNYVFNAGIYYDTLIASHGCYIIQGLAVTVFPLSQSSDTVVICSGEGVWLGSNWLTSPGTYVDTLQNMYGCDSIAQLHVVVNPVSSSNNTLQLCSGDSAYAGGAYQQTSGTYYDTIQATSGCDSIVITQLVVNPVHFNQQTLHICLGDSAWLAGSYQTQSGLFTDSMQTTTGCDSILLTNLVVANPPPTSQILHLCSGDSVWLGGNYQYASGSYVDTLQGSFGCDSLVFTNLTVHSDTAFQHLTLCLGDSVWLANSWQHTAGVYVDVFTSSSGCDSLLQTTLSVLPFYHDSSTTTFCAGDSVPYLGSWISTNTLLSDTLSSSQGCDSILTRHFVELPANSVALDTLDYDTVCLLASSLALPAALPINGTFSGPGVDGVTFTPADAGIGTHTLVYTATDSFGCVAADSIVIHVVSCVGLSEAPTQMQARLFPNPARAQAYVQLSGAKTAWHVALVDIHGHVIHRAVVQPDAQALLSLNHLAQGIYLVRVSQGDWQQKLRLVIQ